MSADGSGDALLPVAVRRPTPVRSPAEIERDIERTRGEIGITLKLLERRLAARHLVAEGFDMVKDSFVATGALNRGLDLVRANPVPFALIGIGAVWVAATNTGIADRIARDRRVPAAGTAGRVGIGGGSDRPLGHTGNPLVNQAGGARSGAWVHHMEDTAQEAVRTVRDSGGAMVNEVGERAGRVAGQVADTVERHPLAIGAVGLIAGALVALLLPRTRAEDELLGGARDRLWHEAEKAGQGAVSRVREAAARGVAAAGHAAAETIDPGGARKAQQPR